FFNLGSCPAGWSALPAAQGRYLVGLPSSGTLLGTQGTALSDHESRAVGQHNHGVTDSGHGHAITDPGHVHNIPSFAGASGPFVQVSNGSFTGDAGGYVESNTTGITINSNTTGVSVNNAGSVAGTNAPYLQLLVC